MVGAVRRWLTFGARVKGLEGLTQAGGATGDVPDFGFVEAVPGPTVDFGATFVVSVSAA
jgi:hypothetical protein